MKIARVIEDQPVLPDAVIAYARAVYLAEGDVTRALDLLDEAFALASELQEQGPQAFALNVRAGLAIGERDPQARTIVTHGLEVAREMDWRGTTATMLCALSDVAGIENDLPLSRSSSSEAANICRELDDVKKLSDAIERLAHVALLKRS